MSNFRAHGNGASQTDRAVDDRSTGGQSDLSPQINDTQDFAEACAREAEMLLDMQKKPSVARALSVAQLANAAARAITVGNKFGHPRGDGVIAHTLRTK